MLSVDDDPVNQMVIENMLSKAGYRVLKAPDGQKALDMLEVRAAAALAHCAAGLLCCWHAAGT